MSTDLDFEAVAEAFYAALFREAPDVERLFRDETNKTVMFVNALESISDMERGDPHFADFMAMLGQRHREIGITQQHLRAGWTAFNRALDVSGGKPFPATPAILQGRVQETRDRDEIRPGRFALTAICMVILEAIGEIAPADPVDQTPPGRASSSVDRYLYCRPTAMPFSGTMMPKVKMVPSGIHSSKCTQTGGS